MDTLVVGIICFILGNICGYFLRKVIIEKSFRLDDEARMNILIIVVSACWLISVIVDMVSPIYETSPFLHSIMGAIVGFFFYRPKK